MFLECYFTVYDKSITPMYTLLGGAHTMMVVFFHHIQQRQRSFGQQVPVQWKIYLKLSKECKRKHLFYPILLKLTLTYLH